MSAAHPLSGICDVWSGLAKKADEHKDEAFGKAARECWKFFDQTHDFMYEKSDDPALGMSPNEKIKTSFRMTCNKVAELVQIFGPTMYFKNPHRQVNPRIPEVPTLAFQAFAQDPLALQAAQQQFSLQSEAKKAVATLLEDYLNYLPNELGLKEESRVAVDEALIKGRGILWHEMYSPPGSTIVMPWSYWVSVDDLLIDPDAEKLSDACWVMRRRVQPIYQVEERFGLERDSLKKAGRGESVTQQALVESKKDNLYYRKRGDTQDLLVYYEIWSKCGLGQYLKQTTADSIITKDINGMRDTLDQFGRYCYLAVAPGVEYPLNLPPEVMDLDVEQEQNLNDVLERVRWPIPFYYDVGGNGWPFSELDFHPVPRSVWPYAHMKPALGELKFINWAMSFLAGRIHVTSRTFIGYLESLDGEVKEAILNGGDLTAISIKGVMGGKSINEMVQFLQHPPVNKDIWDIVNQVIQMFDKRVGLTELMYGLSGRQFRSAEEAQVKNEQISIRPDDMAERVEEWQTHAARKEAIMARLYVGPESVSAHFGEQFDPQGLATGPLTRLWAQFVYRPPDYNNPQTILQVMREFDYRIEAGSVRKPNRDRDQSNMNEAMTTLAPLLEQRYAMTGDPTQLNALFTAWARTRDLDVKDFLFPPAPQPQPQQPQQPQQQQPQAQGAA